MFLRRSHLRVPALLGLVLLLLTGARDAYGIGVCPMHGADAEGVAGVAGVDGATHDLPVVAASEAGGHAHHSAASSASDHGHHGHPAAVGSQPTPPTAAEDSHGHDGGACECRIHCISGSVTVLPEPSGASLQVALPSVTGVELASVDVGLLPALHPPHLLPFATAPPTVH